jgi:hypothetical protein
MQMRPATTATRQPPLRARRRLISSQPPRTHATVMSRRQPTPTAHCSSTRSKQLSARTEVLHSNTPSTPHIAHSASNSQRTCSDPHLVLTSSSSIVSNSSFSDPHLRHSAMSQINTLRRISRQIAVSLSAASQVTHRRISVYHQRSRSRNTPTHRLLLDRRLPRLIHTLPRRMTRRCCNDPLLSASILSVSLPHQRTLIDRYREVFSTLRLAHSLHPLQHHRHPLPRERNLCLSGSPHLHT